MASSKQRKKLYNSKVYTTKHSDKVLFFVCPYLVKIWIVRHILRGLQKQGYTVVAYDTTNDTFLAGDPALLEAVIVDVKADIQNHVSAFRKQGVTEFCFLGSSLGTFILYNCINDVKALQYGVFNTGGNIAHGMWKLPRARRSHQKRGISLPMLEQHWHELQHPKFENLAGHSYAFVSSDGDTIVPLKDIDPYIDPVRNAGVSVRIVDLKTRSHVHTVYTGLRNAAALLEQVKADAK